MTTEIVPYVALDAAMNISSVLAENLDGEQIGPQDLPRAKMPAGGGSSWELPGLGGVESLKEIVGIVIHSTLTRAYWPGRKVTDQPPQCSSPDAVIGVGDPGGECAACPLAQFGSDEEGSRGQACKLSRQCFVLTPSSLLPVVVALPPTSLKSWRSYVLGLTGAQIGLSGTETIFALAQAKNSDGTAYSRVVLRPGRRLEDIEEAQARDYSKAVKSVLTELTA